MEKKKFIENHLHLFDEHDLDEIYRRTFIKQFNRISKIFIDYRQPSMPKVRELVKDPKGFSSPREFKIDFTTTPELNLQRLVEALGKKGIALSEFLLYLEYHRIFDEYWLQRDSDEKKFSISTNHRVIELASFIWYIYSGFLHTYGETEDLLKGQNVKYNDAKYEFVVGNINVKCYLNGRLDIKDLTIQQEAILDRFFKLKATLI